MIYKKVFDGKRNRNYWSDDGGLTWYWVGSRKP